MLPSGDAATRTLIQGPLRTPESARDGAQPPALAHRCALEPMHSDRARVGHPTQQRIWELAVETVGLPGHPVGPSPLTSKLSPAFSAGPFLAGRLRGKVLASPLDQEALRRGPLNQDLLDALWLIDLVLQELHPLGPLLRSRRRGTALSERAAPGARSGTARRCELISAAPLTADALIAGASLGCTKARFPTDAKCRNQLKRRSQGFLSSAATIRPSVR